MYQGNSRTMKAQVTILKAYAADFNLLDAIIRFMRNNDTNKH